MLSARCFAVRINDFELPDTVVERQADIIIPLPRCAGYAPVQRWQVCT